MIGMTEEQPPFLSAEQALQVIRALAAQSDNIVIIQHARQRGRQRRISPRQIQLCCLKGSIVEGPFLNPRGQWQVNLFRYAAGEAMTCVAAIDWPSRLIIITVF